MCVCFSDSHFASVPFCWEKQPGKPKNPLLPLSYPKCLELPPRLLLPGEFTQMPLPERKHRLFGFIRRKGKGEVVYRGNYVFPSEKERAGEINNMKIMKFNRSGASMVASLCKGLKQAIPRKNKKVRSESL
ncbi:hypothetical protein Bca52824_044484 [Brassica carinata]|uniref:Uncharacterized protein n=1 Tax=Brassica carinata TaxID=52824 RepID=A0A8X7UM15_BRACI|nr:hypothetical protein Bca52824_044484 [Brassica carinata]